MSKIIARVELQSYNQYTDRYITTFWVQIPKMYEAQINKHRAFAICWESDRATPCKKVRQEVLNTPYVPQTFVKNGKGMVSHTEFPTWLNNLLRNLWSSARYPACLLHWVFEKVGVHKQYTNRILGMWRWQRGVITATEVSNFFWLRYAQNDPQPETKDLATQMFNGYVLAEPQVLDIGEWHLPFVTPDEKGSYPLTTLLTMSVARSGRAGRKGLKGVTSDLELVNKTFLPSDGKPPHLTPFEHVAVATMDDTKPNAQYWGFRSYRDFVFNQQGSYKGLQKGKIGGNNE